MSTTKRTPPKKPSRDFPLTPHPCGSWCKKIAGKLRYFGPWADPDAARKRYDEFAASVRAGRMPRPVPDGSVKVNEVCNRFVTYQHTQAQLGQIKLRSFRNFKSIVGRFADYVGKSMTVGEIHPEVFAAYRQKELKALGVDAIRKHASIIRQMFGWAYQQDYIDQPVKFGAGFKVKAKPPGRVKLFTPDEVRRIIDAAPATLKAMVLLAINCGFGQTDLGNLPESAVSLTAGFIDFPRPKTGTPRRCPLWPETVQAMRDALAVRPRPADAADAGLFFLTNRGTKFVRETARMKEGVIQSVLIVDSIGPIFAKLMGRCGIWKLTAKGNGESDGRNFYTFRRTHRTWTDECGDEAAADLLMGHTRRGMARVYVQQIQDSRLKALTDHLRSKVFDKPAVRGAVRPTRQV